MKIVVLIISIFITLCVFSQNGITGNWEGIMKSMQGGELIFVLKIQKNKENPVLFYCPSLGIREIKVEKVKIKPDTISFSIPEMKGRFSGKLTNDSTIEGFFSQSIINNPITLYRKEKVKEILRPQEPVPPFPYVESKVKFENKEAGIKLSGTLTLPKESYKAPCVILISGSGQQNRDEELLGHKPFLVLSDYLTRHGIAVLRYDDRGAGESEGNPFLATSRDFAGDLKSAIKFLRNHKGINSSDIGLIGHSEGGIIAGMVAAEDTTISFVIALAGPSLPGDIILQEQTKLILANQGVEESLIAKNMKVSKKIHKILKKDLSDKVLSEKITKEYKRLVKKLSPEELTQLGLQESTLNISVQQLITPWFKFFVKYNPALDYSKIKCPFLGLNGSEDIQVPAVLNEKGYKEIFVGIGKTDYELKTFKGLNHLFQTCNTCEIMEYGLIEETFNEEVMLYIKDWILKNRKKR
ncbi:MAG: alpha/beta hydrolase [Bacteroidales bacterium]|nr:alpha/beta hydrolase [Bacteroidales bacterium]